MITEQAINFLIVGGILIALFSLCSVVIVKRFVSKEMINAGNQYLGQNIYMQYQNADKKQAIEEVMFRKEDDRQDDFNDCWLNNKSKTVTASDQNERGSL